LGICLINFVNVILVLQKHSFYFKLINQLPSMVVTQSLLARIVFKLKMFKNQTDPHNLPSITTSKFPNIYSTGLVNG